MFPLNILLILTSCILNAPILPLFTLPIFLLSYPRPQKFWPTTVSLDQLFKCQVENLIKSNWQPISIDHHSNDAIYYQQLFPRLIESLHRQQLFWDFCYGGQFLLARFDDRLMWLQVLECGHNYAQVQMKGLELQETSCHTIEANSIDHLIEMANSANNICDRFINSNFYFTMNLLTKTPVKTYSGKTKLKTNCFCLFVLKRILLTDAKNVLTGIIDSPETYMRIKALYCQVFIWVLLQNKIFDVNQTKSHKSKQNDQVLVVMEPNDVGLINEFGYEQLQPKAEWSNASYHYSKNKSINHIVNYFIYPSEWFQEILKVLTLNASNLNSNEIQSLSVTYRHITNVCFSIVFPASYTEVPTAQTICETYNGELGKDIPEKKLFNSNQDLYKVCVKSFQYTTKIAFDQMIFANEELKFEELIEILQDFDDNWYFGNSNHEDWKQAVIDEKMYLFSISKDMVKVIRI